MAFPTPGETFAFATLKDVADFIPLNGTTDDKTTPRGAIYALLGVNDTTPPRVLGMETENDFDGEVNNCRLDPDGTPTRPPMAARGAMKLLGKICRVMAGTEPHPHALPTPTAAPPQPATQMAAAVATAANPQAIAPGQQAIGINNIIHLNLITQQSDDSTTLRMDDTTFLQCLARWKKVFGTHGKPKPSAEPTYDQLSCLKALLDNGRVPYVDFAIFGPDGARMAQKLKLSGHMLGGDGIFRMMTIAGPPHIDSWMLSSEVWANSMIMLGAIDLGNLITYQDHIRTAYLKLGEDAWMLIYQADVRARLELMPRLNTDLAVQHQAALDASGTTPYNPQRPWDYTLHMLLSQVKFWKDELEDPGLRLLAATNNVADFIGGDAPISMDAEPSTQRHNRGKRGTNPHPRGKRQNSGTQSSSTPASGVHTANRKGHALCAGWNNGSCTGSVGGFCPMNPNLKHQCNICLAQDHGAHQCTAAQVRAPRHDGGGKGRGKGKGRGNGRGKGRGKKGGKGAKTGKTY